MEQAFLEAYRALGTTGKNPNVGCVLVKNNKIIGRSRTFPNGRPHAEERLINTLSKSDLKNSSLFVSLEPCAHKGPDGYSCADLIAKSGIKEIFISNIDPNRNTFGKGIRILKKAGIRINKNFLEKEGQIINRGYLKKMNEGRPFVTLKLALSLDGKIALKNKKSKWITNKISRNYGHLIRSQSDAILTSSETVINDNSKLTCRLKGLEKYSPIKVVVDRHLRVNKDSFFFKTNFKGKIIVYFDSKVTKKKFDYPSNVTLIDLNHIIIGDVSFFEAILKDLSNKNIKNLLIESGPTFYHEMLKKGLIDEIAFFKSNILIGNDGIPIVKELDYYNISDVMKYDIVENKRFIDDIFELRRLVL